MTSYLVDTSAWIEYARDTGSPSCEYVDRLIRDDHAVHLTEPVIMELLAGAGPRTIDQTEKLVGAFPILQVHAQLDYHEAAKIYRMTRWSGFTPRSMIDCLIAAVAARNEVTVVHGDRDFRFIAERYPLAVAP
ncbi:MAG TPA: PIN domain nuclease [Mycobacteriales bacterium]|nr:PIN domain nuclease [Mycobacteriales bacterium]